MSTGPIGGAPVPSIRMLPRRISLSNGPSPSARGGDFGMGLGSSWDRNGAEMEINAMKSNRALGSRFSICGSLLELGMRIVHSSTGLAQPGHPWGFLVSLRLGAEYGFVVP